MSKCAKIVAVVAAVVVVGAVAIYVRGGQQAASQGLSEQQLEQHLSAVINKQAGVPIDQVGDLKIEQIKAFHTVLRPVHSDQFNGYEIVLSGLDATTCNQIMKSPWVENVSAAKALSTSCDDPKAEIRLMMVGQ